MPPGPWPTIPRLITVESRFYGCQTSGMFGLPGGLTTAAPLEVKALA